MSNTININKMDNIIIETDKEGHNIIINKRNLKYNRLISNTNAAYLLRKNTVIINNKDVPNTIIESDNCGFNTVKSFDEYVQEEMDEFSENIFKDILMKTRKKKDIRNNLVDVYLAEKRDNLQEKLKKATEYNQSLNYLKAIELYENALQDIKNDSYPDEFMLDDCDILAIKFALVLNKLKVRDYKRLQAAKDILNSLIEKYGTSFPSMYYYLATVYYDFGYFDKAIKSLEEGLKALNILKSLKVIHWPGTKEIMVANLTKTELQEKMETLLNECKVDHPPDRKCLFTQCESNNKIYFMNLNFNGYVAVTCSCKCYFSYHASCWKKKLKQDGIKAKTVLNQICPTDDCGGHIEEISIFDQSLQLASSISSEKAQNKNTKNGFEYNPIHKDHKFKSKKDKVDINSLKTTHSLNEENKNRQDLSSAHTQIKSDEEVFKQIPTDSTQDCSSQTTIKSQLNFNTKEYVPSTKLPMFKVCDQFTQTSETVVSQKDYDLLKYNITILQTELLKTEEKYNDLLRRYESLKLEKVLNLKSTVDVWTETESVSCLNCSSLEKEIKDNNVISNNLVQSNENLKFKIRELEHQLNEFKTTRLLDKEIYDQSEQKFLQSNKILMHKLKAEIEEKQKLQHEFNEYKNRQDENKVLKDMVVQQILHFRTFYLSYINVFQNKCKHMIWELEDIKTLASADTLPSFSDIEDNLLMWKQSLESAVNDYAMMMQFYDKLIQNFSSTNKNLVAFPIPNLIPEPPSVILRHFKSFFLLNKRLEQDLNRHIANYYKILSMPYQNMSQSSTSTELRNKEFNFNTPQSPDVGLEETVVNQEQTTKEVETLQTSFESTLQEEAAGVDLNSSVQEISKQSENVGMREKISENPSPIPAKLVVGPDGLLFKLQQKCPLTPPYILQEAIRILREARGGLSGLDSKTLLTELKIIITDLLKKERQKPGYQKISGPEKSSPWAPINNEVQWYNANPRGNCAICFDRMTKSNSTRLKCQHVFHTACIKKWLPNNGICPICRSFTTLDDEFPPLK